MIKTVNQLDFFGSFWLMACSIRFLNKSTGYLQKVNMSSSIKHTSVSNDVFVFRSDHSQHTVCLPDEDQKSVAVLCSHPPPAGQTLCCSSLHVANSQHFLNGTNWSGDLCVPPLQSLCAISPRKGCLLRAPSAGGTQRHCHANSVQDGNWFQLSISRTVILSFLI